MADPTTVSEIVVTAPVTFGHRQIGDFTAQVMVEEDHTDELTVTDHPVEQGATISDHAFKNPARLTVVAGWSNSSFSAALSEGKNIRDRFNAGGITGAFKALTGAHYVRDIYARFLKMQATRLPITVTTGKRKYRNMLITSLATTTTTATENSLIVVVGLREVILVQTQATTVPPRENQANPAQTADTTNAGNKQANPAKAANAKSLLQTLLGAF